MTRMQKLGFGLSAERKTDRINSIGGSDANIILSGIEPQIIDLWLEKTGQKDAPDFSDNYLVQIGHATEPLNADIYERQTGRFVTDEQRICVHKQHAFMTCTLDGLTTTSHGHKAVFEAKYTNPFMKVEQLVQAKMPQLHHNMACAGVEWAVLSVLNGVGSYDMYEVHADVLYTAELIEAEQKFWHCVQTKTSPFVTHVRAPISPENWKTVDMTGNNAWASAAHDWSENKDAARIFEAAKKKLGSLLAEDTGCAFGHGIVAKRSKNGAIKIDFEKTATQENAA